MANNEAMLNYLKATAGKNMFGPGGGGPAYNPHRDITALFIIAFHELLEDLVTDDMAPDIRKDLDDSGIETSELLDCYNKYADMLNYFTGKGTKTLDECAEKSRYSECDHRVKSMVERMIGRYMTGAYFYGIRDITTQGDSPNEYTLHYTLEQCMDECRSAMDGVETEWAKFVKARRFGNGDQ